MLKLRIESGDAAVSAPQWDDAVYVAAGRDPFELAERAVCQAAALSGGAKPRRQKVMPPTLDVFGWCTWDAFYSRVSARGTWSFRKQVLQLVHCILMIARFYLLSSLT